MAETGSIIVKIDDDRIKERVWEFLAEAWAEGYIQGADDHHQCGEICKVSTEPINPYRQ